MKKFDEIWIDEDAADTALALRLRALLPEHRIRIASAPEGADRPGFKRTLWVTRERGRFLRTCPGTPGMQCCNLFVLNPIVGCPYDCAYCFLQAYQNEPFITLYANLEAIEREVEDLKALNPGRTLRICTGELADSLALEPIAEAATYLVELFRGLEGVQLELKTKSTRIDPLLDLEHGGRTVISWSLNPPQIAAALEQGTPHPHARIDAARKATDAGYPVAFHFDPMVRRPGWKEDYTHLVERLFRTVPVDSVRWISLGGFRYTPAMKALIQNRFPDSRLFLEEFVPCPDGKYRYFSGHRVEMYRVMRECLERVAEAVPVYLCMEASFIWQRVFGYLPEASRQLDPIFGSCVAREEG